jgi:CRP/FNR family transcriptional regulator, cyclic AMP receptor protein
MAQELNLEQVVAFLVDAPLFGDLDPAELAELVNAMQVQVLEPGSWVFREGDPGDAWYVLYDGEVEVVKRCGTGERVIAILGRRACFGEMAILDGSPRSASVRTTTRSRVFRFPRASFTRLLAEGTLAAYKLVYQIALVLVSRQRRTTSRLAEAMSAADSGELNEVLIPIVDQSAVAE